MVVIIGDGVMIVGMVFEVMNDVVVYDVDLMVVLNDNDMLILCSIGGFVKYLVLIWESG